VGRGPLVSFFEGFFRSTPYLLKIAVAAEAGYHRTVWPAQDDDARIAN
jgi:hypothetical protein